MTTVKIISNDDREFTVPKKVAEMSEFIEEMMISINDPETPVLLPNVDGASLEKVLKYCTYHIEHDPISDPDNETILDWDKQFCEVENPELFRLLGAANDMSVKPLLKLLCHRLADLLKGKTTAEMRTLLGIEGDLTPEEESRYREEIRTWDYETDESSNTPVKMDS